MQQLAALMITRQVIGNLKESLWPLISQSYKFTPREEITQAEVESKLLFYQSTFDDYLEMFIQFAYVILFSSTFPLAALCALINNVIEIRSDAFKLCVIYQRPFSTERVKNIGEWLNAMSIMIYISIFVNCALIAKSNHLNRILPLDDIHIVLVAVILEVIIDKMC